MSENSCDTLDTEKAVATPAPGTWVSTNFSVFDNCKETRPRYNLTLRDLYEGIRSGQWKAEVKPCRSILQKQGREAYKASRDSVTCVSVSAIVKHRRKGSTATQKGAVHSGLLQLDFDANDHTGMTIEAIRAIVQAAPFVLTCFVSISGDGVKAFARIPANFDTHLGSWLAAEAYFAARGLTLDPATKDPFRLCFVSFDPGAFWWEDSGLGDNVEELVPLAVPERRVGEGSRGSEDPEHVHMHLARLAKKIGSRPGRPIWIHIVAATVDAVGIESAGEIVDEHFPLEDGDESASDIAPGLTGSWMSLWKYGLDPQDHSKDFADLPDHDDETPRADTPVNEARSDEKGRLLEKLALRKFDFNSVPEKPPAVLKLDGVTISTAGNLTNIQAPPKAGKSAVIGAIIAAMIRGDIDGGDCLGFTSNNPEGKAVIHFDTEQSRFDHDALVRRSLKRAGIVADPPPWLLSYSLADIDIKERRQALAAIMAEAAAIFGGILAVIMDGVGDLCMALNDDIEAFGLVGNLHKAAIRYDCPIITVLHENPGSEHGKTRGHLGSQLERKAETNLRLSKDAAGVTTIFTERSRHCQIPKSRGICFRWDDLQRMHVSCGGAAEVRADAKRASMEEDASRVLKEGESYSHGKLREIVSSVLELGERAARTRIENWLKVGIVSKDEAGKYHLVPSDCDL